MSTIIGKSTYPIISTPHWWTLRERFKTKIPSSVDAAYLSSVLGNMTANSARSNVQSPLRLLGIIDKDNRPTEIAELWRMDNTYSAACERIISHTYPPGLLDAVPADAPDFGAAQTWFMTVARVGQQAAAKMARTYILICEADSTKRSEAKAPTVSSRRKASETPKTNAKALPKAPPDMAKVQEKIQEASHSGSHDGRFGRVPPSIHIDVQIHISADSTEKQIDQVFASMAMHLYGNKMTNDE